MSEYADDLIPERLEALIVEGVESGEPTDMTRQDWVDIRAEGLQLLETRNAQTA